MRHNSARSIVIGLVLALASAWCCGPASAARWLRADSPLFTVYSDGDQATLRAFTQDLQDYDALLRSVTGITAPQPLNKLTVYLLDSKAGLREINRYAPGEVIGFYNATPNGIFLAAIRNSPFGERMPARTVIFHEYTHHFVHQYASTLYPDWLDEGLAEYYATAEIKADQVELGHVTPGRMLELETQPWIPVEKLLTAHNDHQRERVFYAEAWLITHYMMETPERRKQLADYLQATERGMDNAHAFASAFGMTFDAFDDVMKDYFLHDKPAITALPRPVDIAPTDIAVVALPPSADQLLLLHARMIDGAIKQGDVASLVKEARGLTAAFPDDPLALRTVGMAEAFYGDPNKADIALDHLLALQPDDVEALQIKARRYLMAGRKQPGQRIEMFSKARFYADEVSKLDPNNYQALYIDALAGEDRPGSPSAGTLNTFLRAHQLAPQVTELSLNVATALLHAGRMAEAKDILDRLANSPHAGGGSEAARDMLKKVAAGVYGDSRLPGAVNAEAQDRSAALP
jgi:tetratricopeptide (TPR) repeat protein